MADNLVFEESLNSEVDGSEFISKKWIYVNDNNSQNYTSQIVIDSTPLSNAGGWVDWNQAFLMLPLVVNLAGETGAIGVGNLANADYAWAFKNGFWNIINSMTCEFNNQNVVQQTPLLNVFQSFRAMTSFSQDDLVNNGPSLGFAPDTGGSWQYSNAGITPSTNTYTSYSANGTYGLTDIGISNNRDSALPISYVTTDAVVPPTTAGVVYSLPATGVAGQPFLVPITGTTTNSAVIYSGATTNSVYQNGDYACNEGMRKRQSWNSYNPTASLAYGQGTVNPPSACNATFRNYTTSGQAGEQTWYVYAKLRLKDLAEFFEKMPLLKGSTMRFYINTNQAITNFSVSRQVITTATGVVAQNGALNITSTNVIGGLTNPLMIASVGAGQGGVGLCGRGAASIAAAATPTYSLSVSIFKNNFQQYVSTAGVQGASSTGQQSSLTSCRLYAPVYQMNPLAQSRYLSLAPTKRVVYNDIFQYQFTGVASNSPFNFLVTNGIANIKSVLVVPMFSATAGGVPISPLLNPCNTTPATSDCVMITNFNILVSGINLFLNNENYDFEQFNEQLLQSKQLNGSLTTGLASGLISQDMFARGGYRYLYGDCSRTLPSEAGVSRSIQIQGQNVSSLPCDLYVFVEFQKEITIDIATGARIE